MFYEIPEMRNDREVLGCHFRKLQAKNSTLSCVNLDHKDTLFANFAQGIYIIFFHFFFVSTSMFINYIINSRGKLLGGAYDNVKKLSPTLQINCYQVMISLLRSLFFFFPPISLSLFLSLPLSHYYSFFHYGIDEIINNLLLRRNRSASLLSSRVVLTK